MKKASVYLYKTFFKSYTNLYFLFMSEMWITLTSNSVWFWFFLVKPKGTIFAFVIYKCKFIFIVGFFFFLHSQDVAMNQNIF